MKTIILILFTTVLFSQNSFVAAGNSNETFGENITRMQEFDTIVKEVSLGVPKFETPIEKPKPIVKKKLSWWQKLLKAIFG